ncbi:hypothetical protein PMIN06_004588 [Paraphaeosphaeria minitans]
MSPAAQAVGRNQIRSFLQGGHSAARVSIGSVCDVHDGGGPPSHFDGPPVKRSGPASNVEQAGLSGRRAEHPHQKVAVRRRLHPGVLGWLVLHRAASRCCRRTPATLGASRMRRWQAKKVDMSRCFCGMGSEKKAWAALGQR